jgi:predicted nucleotide-binding protein
MTSATAFDSAVFEEINNAVIDLLGSTPQTFERPLKRLSGLLHSSGLESLNQSLIEGTDFDAFLAASKNTGGGMMGSQKLLWPDDPDRELGLTLILIDRLAANPSWAFDFCHTFFYSGNSIVAGIHTFTRQILVPFARDYRARAEKSLGRTVMRQPPGNSRKVFIVHGHDEGAREAVARFLSKIGFEPVILHEQASQGRTVIEKVEAHSEVGFAVVLLSPDDEGCVKGGPPQPRARQNVLLELGYFIGHLGRDRVCALKRGDLEIPSDFGGVVYEPFDAGNGWKLALARELKAAGHDVDWNKVMTP